MINLLVEKNGEFKYTYRPDYGAVRKPTAKKSLTVQNQNAPNTATKSSSVVQTQRFSTQSVENLQSKRT